MHANVIAELRAKALKLRRAAEGAHREHMVLVARAAQLDLEAAEVDAAIAVLEQAQ